MYLLSAVTIPLTEYKAVMISGINLEYNWELVKLDTKLDIIQKIYVGRWAITAPILNEIQKIVDQLNSKGK